MFSASVGVQHRAEPPITPVGPLSSLDPRQRWCPASRVRRSEQSLGGRLRRLSMARAGSRGRRGWGARSRTGLVAGACGSRRRCRGRTGGQEAAVPSAPEARPDRIGLALALLGSGTWSACRTEPGRRSSGMGATSRTFGDGAIVTGDGHCPSAPRQRGGEAAPDVFAFAVNLTGEQRVSRASVCRATGSRVADSSSSFYEEGFCAAENWRQPARAERPAAERRYRPGVGVDSLTPRHGVPTVIRKLP